MAGILRKYSLCFLLISGAAFGAPPAPVMDLRFDRLASALTLMNDEDRKIVSQAAQLIRDGQHVGALARLSALTGTNPDNSSLRILIGFVQLQLGNLTGALEEAKKAHDSPNGNSYRCYFLAKVALLTGDKVTCQRELNHVKNAGDMKDETRQLEADLKKAKSGS